MVAPVGVRSLEKTQYLSHNYHPLPGKYPWLVADMGHVFRVVIDIIENNHQLGDC